MRNGLIPSIIKDVVCGFKSSNIRNTTRPDRGRECSIPKGYRVAREPNPRFEVMPAGEMRAKYGFSAENRPIIKLNPRAVPPALRPLIPLAEQFGVGDDLIRADVLAKTPAGEVAAMRAAVAAHADDFDNWLAGPDADGPAFSPEYTAFTCLRMAADVC